jgi:hypothetical protein
MGTGPAPPDAAPLGEPLNAFAQCHAGLLSQLRALGELPVLVAAAARARTIASDSLALFEHAVFNHHGEEEEELFPAVLRSARPGAERDRVQALVDQLTGEHRVIEALWKRLEAAVNAAASGKDADIDALVLAELVGAYDAHARVEETQFLPLAERILGRDSNHMAALGVSIHLRHAAVPPGYI